MTRTFPLRAVLIFGIVVALVVGLLSWRASCSGDERAQRNTQVATGKALDKVAEQTPIIRQDQEEKQREVDQIPGADQRLPDGFGRDLERVRRGGRHP